VNDNQKGKGKGKGNGKGIANAKARASGWDALDCYLAGILVFAEAVVLVVVWVAG